MLSVQGPVVAVRPVVRRARDMGLQPRPDANGMPFSYDLDSDDPSLFSDPPAAPGQPLLSDLDSMAINGFFDNITHGNIDNILNGDGLQFTDDWLLPPQYLGSATSFGQQPSAIPDSSPNLHRHSGAGPSSSTMPPPPLPQSQPLFEQDYELLAAASTLSQNGSASPLNLSNLFRSFSPGNMGSPFQNIPHRPSMNGLPRETRRMSSHPQIPEDDHTLFVDMLHGQTSRQSGSGTKLPEVVKFGSDVSFGRNNFTPQSEKETSEELEKKRVTYLGCLEVNKSAANTRPSSPVPDALRSPLKLKSREPVFSAVKDDPDGPPARKRRKSRAKDEYDDADDSHRRKRSKTDASLGSASPPPGTEGSGKRRKSGGKGALTSKGPKENLSEEQKRENHIKSEQKRRTLIKEGFDNLCDLVPGLKGGGFSKSTMLTMAAEWLEKMIQGNDQLKERLEGMGLEHTGSQAN